MHGSDGRKQEIRITPLRLVPIQRTPEELAQIELCEAVNAARIRTPRKPRRFHKVSAGELFPVRLLARLTDDAVRAGCDETEWLRLVVPVISNLIRRKFVQARRPRYDTGEHPRAA